MSICHWTDLSEIGIENLCENLSRNSIFSYSQAKILVAVPEDLGTFVVAGDTILPQKQSLQVRWYQCVRIDKEVSTLCAYGTVLCFTYIELFVVNLKQMVTEATFLGIIYEVKKMSYVEMTSIHPSFNLSIHQSIHPPIHPSNHPPTHPPTLHPPTHPTTHHPPTHPSNHLFTQSSNHPLPTHLPPTHPFIHLPIHPSNYPTI